MPHRPAHRLRRFFGKLEGGAGKDRSQYSNFIADRYTNAPIIGFIDAEVCFQMPILPSMVVSRDGEGTARQLNNFALGGGSAWGVDNRMLGVTTVLDVMWPDRMPIFFWRKHLASLREHLAARWGRWGSRREDEGGCFDEAFANMTHGGSGMGFVHPSAHKKARWGFSQFNIMANYMFYHQPSSYRWHIGTNNTAPMDSRLKHTLGLAEASIPRYAYSYFDVKGLPGTLETYRQAISREPTVAVGRNGVMWQHTLKYTCCKASRAAYIPTPSKKLLKKLLTSTALLVFTRPLIRPSFPRAKVC
jgi:hypothetical protein